MKIKAETKDSVLWDGHEYTVYIPRHVMHEMLEYFTDHARDFAYDEDLDLVVAFPTMAEEQFMRCIFDYKIVKDRYKVKVEVEVEAPNDNRAERVVESLLQHPDYQDEIKYVNVLSVEEDV
jgi:hypothetical protein